MNKNPIIVVLLLSLIFVSELSFGQAISKRWPVANDYYSVKSNADTFNNFNRSHYPIAQYMNRQANYVAANYNPYAMQQQFNNVISRYTQPKMNIYNYPNAVSMLLPQFTMPNFNVIPMMMTTNRMAYIYRQAGFANAPFFPTVGMHY